MYKNVSILLRRCLHGIAAAFLISTWLVVMILAIGLAVVVAATDALWRWLRTHWSVPAGEQEKGVTTMSENIDQAVPAPHPVALPGVLQLPQSETGYQGWLEDFGRTCPGFDAVTTVLLWGVQKRYRRELEELQATPGGLEP